jgi:nucleotide-binding universal stress UspA family protein
MAIIGGFDLHRRQLTYDYLDVVTGQVERGRVVPADRGHLRSFLAWFEGQGEVAFAVEGCTGWRYVVEELERVGIGAHLAEPAETAAKRGRKRRAKTDRSDARHLRELLVKEDLPCSWIPPAQVLEARARVRLYKDLEEERTAWLQRVQATLYHQGVPVIASLASAEGQARLAAAELSPAGRVAVEVGLRQLDRLTAELDPLRAELARFSRRQPGCRALRTTHFGIGPITSVAIWAEMGDPAASPPPMTPCVTPAWTSPSTPPTASEPGATWPVKGRPRCAGRCTRQPCAPPGRTRPTMPTSWRSSAAPTATWG